MKCPCSPEQLYSNCCEPYHQGKHAPAAEILMRSRYSAYVLKLDSYILKTWYSSSRPSALEVENEPIKWLGLSVKKAWGGEKEAFVEFVAKYKIGGMGATKMHEISRFIRENSEWFYVDGQ